MSNSNANTKEVVTLVMDNTEATRKYPFTRETLDQIRALRLREEEQLKKDTGKDYIVPAPMIIQAAVAYFYSTVFGTNK